MTMPPDVTLQEQLFVLRKRFQAADIKSAELDARLLVQASVGFDHAGMILNSGKILNDAELTAIDQMMRRRLEDEPVSRILGEREFYGRQFLITDDVLDPRADTETLVNLALSAVLKNQMSDKPIDILDIGTGSGAIIISLLSELPNARGLATDVSGTALDVAGHNSSTLGVEARLKLLKTSWCEDVDVKFDMIVSNPPYIVSNDIDRLAPDVKNFDPKMALDGGTDGLYAYREIAKQAPARLRTGGVILLEIGFDQAEAVVEILSAVGFSRHPEFATVSKDLGDNDRVVTMLWDN